MSQPTITVLSDDGQGSSLHLALEYTEEGAIVATSSLGLHDVDVDVQTATILEPCDCGEEHSLDMVMMTMTAAAAQLLARQAGLGEERAVSYTDRERVARRRLTEAHRPSGHRRRRPQ